jgi:hemolysin III
MYAFLLRHCSRPHGYSRAERLSDAALHVTGVFAALMAVPVLVTLAAVWRADAAAVTGVAIYGATLIAMLTASATYHMAPFPEVKHILLRFDHSAIFLKIAGTYTPLLLLSGIQATGFLAGIWAAALIGMVLKITAPQRYRLPLLALYIGMGWAGLALGQDFLSALSARSAALVLTGGLLYTLGVVFFLWQHLPFHNTIWHGFVLVATGLFYAAVLIELGHIPEPGSTLSLS